MFYLEAFGLFFALMDFTGLSRYLEAILDGVRERLHGNIRNYNILEVRKNLSSHWKKLDKNNSSVSSGLLFFLNFMSFIFILAFVSFLLRLPFDEIRTLAPIGSSLRTTIVVLYQLIGVFLGILVSFMLLVYLSYATTAIVWSVLYILNLPRAGIVGSIGLIVALVSFSFGHL